MYMETLPTQCPPETAVDIDFDGAYRVVKNNSPTIEDFKSHAALHKPCPEGFDLCRWSSCSLFLSRDKALQIATKLPKLKDSKPHLALLAISQGSGKSLVKSTTKHVDFWMYSNFDPLTAVVETEACA